MAVVYEGGIDLSKGGPSAHFLGLSRELARFEDVTLLFPDYGNLDGVRLATDAGVQPLWVGRKSMAASLRYEWKKAIWLARNRSRRRGRPRTILISRLGLMGFAFVMARLLGYQTVLEVNGWPPDEFASKGWPRVVCRVVALTARMQIWSASSCICVTNGLAERVSAGSDRTFVIPNGADTSVLPANVDDIAGFSLATDLARHRSSGCLRLAYAGALVGWQDLELVLRGIAQLRLSGENVTLTAFGDGLGQERLRELGNELGLANQIIWRGWMPPEALKRELRDHHVGVVPVVAGRLSSPLKLYEYVAEGLRVVASEVDGVREMAGVLPIQLYAPGDVPGFCEALRRAAEMPALPVHEVAAIRESVAWSARAKDVSQVVRATRRH